MDGPWVGATGNATAYGLRGRLGLVYDLDDYTSLGFYYQTNQHFTFEDNIRFPIPGPAGDIYLDTEVELPHNIGIGIANNRLMCGRLLFAADLCISTGLTPTCFDRFTMINSLSNSVVSIR